MEQVLAFGAALLIPLTAPAIEVWAGVDLATTEAAAAVAIALGMVAYASTGLFTAVLLAIDDLGEVLRYKGAQFALALTLLIAATRLGGMAVSVALAIALLGPAVWFNRRAAMVVRVDLHQAAPDAGKALLLLVSLTAAFLGAQGRVTPWVLVLVSLALIGTAAVVGRVHLLRIVRPAAAARQ